MIVRSIISRAAGRTPAAMRALTASEAASTVSKTASMVRTPGGIGTRRTTAWVTIPKVPSEPTITPRRSYPTTSSVWPPSQTTSPSGKTTSSPRT
ncbi:hypothetical protein D3C86_1398860 [compost metagenome]